MNEQNYGHFTCEIKWRVKVSTANVLKLNHVGEFCPSFEDLVYFQCPLSLLL